ncbi:ATP-binding protein [Nocardia altamirensis]|uniref:ATP-binding protein n=1 Tax=Nocardia altamirensis TaxID=472158 RepID=UPI00083FDAF5|nr:ATP-binding protein [Nocardia altamirensis]
MTFVGRDLELSAIATALEATAEGRGGVIVAVGGTGLGKTLLVDHAVRLATDRGIEVSRIAVLPTQPAGFAWASLLRSAGGAPEDTERLLAAPSAVEIDAACAQILATGRQLIAIDDIDRGGPELLAILAVFVSRIATRPIVLVVTSSVPLGVGAEFALSRFTEEQTAALIGSAQPDVAHAVWAASGGVPGTVAALVDEVRRLPDDVDPLVQLALLATSYRGTYPRVTMSASTLGRIGRNIGFLDVDLPTIRLLELALDRPAPPTQRASLLAGLAFELMGDASSVDRRRALIAEATELAERAGDAQTIAEVIHAGMHALWAPNDLEARLANVTRMVALASSCGNQVLEWHGTFWRFVILMETGRIAEAESTLAAYERATSGDPVAEITAVARHGVISILRGRYAAARELIDAIQARGRRVRFADIDRIATTLTTAIAVDCGPVQQIDHSIALFTEAARRSPGHYYEAAAARMLAVRGSLDEAGIELERVLPRLLDGSGPRWLGAMADACEAAVLTADTVACQRLLTVLTPYAGRFVIWFGANMTNGPVERHLGALCVVLGHYTAAVQHYERAAAAEDHIGALPGLARTLAGLADALEQRGYDGDAARAGTARARSDSIATRLGMHLFLERRRPAADEWALRREDDDWILHAGAERVRLRDSRGIGYLRFLVGSPGREIAAARLASGGAIVETTAADPIQDFEAVRAYRKRLDRLAAEADAADLSGDIDRSRRVEAEREAIRAELRQVTALGGRSRTFSTEEERARISVTKALRATVSRIETSAPHCAAHLRASLRTGRFCRYEPAAGGPARWRT